MDISSLASQVKANCNISDSHYWGNYSICGLLLRLRELFRSEMNIPPGDEIPQSDIGPWISGREELWRNLEGEDYQPLEIEGTRFKPFDAEDMNRVLMPAGLLYGAGLGVHMKPVFFLADLLSSKRAGDFEILVAGKEHARDLSAHPAMLQGDTILARIEPLTSILWERLAEARNRRSCGALGYAFSSYGIDPLDAPNGQLRRKMAAVADSEVETIVHHEIGEAVEGRRLGGAWKKALAGSGQRRAEAFYRGIKDVLADTSDHGMLRHIIERRKGGSLGFYRASAGGYSQLIFPEIRDAFERFRAADDWEAVEAARMAGYARAAGLAARVLEIHASGGDGAEAVVIRELIDPLQAPAK